MTPTTAADRIDHRAASRRLGALSAVLVGVLLLLALTINSSALTALDRSVWAWFDVHQSRSWHVDATGAFSYLGRPFHVATAGVVAGTLLGARTRSVLPAVLIIGGVGIGVVVEQALKATVHRIADVSPTFPYYHHSFPSGHVTGSVTLLGLIAVCLGAHGRRKAALVALVIAGVVTVALLALYSYSHTFTDVLGGLALGGAIVAAGAAVWASTGTEREPE